MVIPPVIVETNPQIKKNKPSRTLRSVPDSCDGGKSLVFPLKGKIRDYLF
jgi:hypothetical protein